MLKISDIAQHVGVSATTVSYVLSDGPAAARISPETRAKILKAAEELGYRSNHFARAMRTGDTKMLGVLGGRTEEPHVGRMIEGTLDAADAHGYTLKLLRLHAMGNSARHAIRRSSELRLSGILALHLPEDTLEELHLEAHKYQTPLVLMDTYCQNAQIHQVVSDDEGGFSLGVQHLAQLGHRKIGMVKGGGTTAIGVARKYAFVRALAAHGLQPEESLVQEGSFHDRAASVEAARRLLTLPEGQRPTAIFCASDLMALATLRAARELGLDVPRQVSVIGFSNMIHCEYAYPALTTIDQGFQTMGSTALNLLLGLIAARGQEHNEAAGAKEATPAPAGNVTLLPTSLVVRESTCPPPTGG